MVDLSSDEEEEESEHSINTVVTNDDDDNNVENPFGIVIGVSIRVFRFSPFLNTFKTNCTLNKFVQISDKYNFRSDKSDV